MTHERTLRRRADKQGLKLIKSRSHDANNPAFGLYALTDQEHGGTIHENFAGQPYALTLEDVESHLADC